MDLRKYYNGFVSERLIFRKLTCDDVGSWAAFYYHNPSLKYLGIDTSRTPQAMAKAWIDAQLARYEKNEFGQLALVLRHNNELIGTRGFKYCVFDGQRYLEGLGSVKPAYWRQGFGSESMACAAGFIFKNSFANCIVSFCHAQNNASLLNLKKQGFQKIARQQIDERPTIVHKLSRSVWESQSTRQIQQMSESKEVTSF